MSILAELQAEGAALIRAPKQPEPAPPVDLFRLRRSEMMAHAERCARDMPTDPYEGLSTIHERSARRRQLILEMHLNGMSKNAIASAVFCGTQTVMEELNVFRAKGLIPAAFPPETRAKTGG